jgi:quercetin dioxygenase-like cupin family protein
MKQRWEGCGEEDCSGSVPARDRKRIGYATGKRLIFFVKLSKEVEMEINRLVESIPWMPHPVAAGVTIKPLISSKDHNLNVTCMLVKVPIGIEVPEHLHDKQDDILYPLKGKALMWVEGAGEFTLEPGIIVKVPTGKKHKIVDVVEELLIYDVFSPALF